MPADKKKKKKSIITEGSSLFTCIHMYPLKTHWWQGYKPVHSFSLVKIFSPSRNKFLKNKIGQSHPNVYWLDSAAWSKTQKHAFIYVVVNVFGAYCWAAEKMLNISIDGRVSHSVSESESRFIKQFCKLKTRPVCDYHFIVSK